MPKLGISDWKLVMFNITIIRSLNSPLKYGKHAKKYLNHLSCVSWNRSIKNVNIHAAAVA